MVCARAWHWPPDVTARQRLGHLRILIEDLIAAGHLAPAE